MSEAAVTDTPPIVRILRDGADHCTALQWAADIREAADTIEALLEALNYVCERTHSEWHFKPGYDPQRVLDAIAKVRGRA
jgi:hypothetical protein